MPLLVFDRQTDIGSKQAVIFQRGYSFCMNTTLSFLSFWLHLYIWLHFIDYSFFLAILLLNQPPFNFGCSVQHILMVRPFCCWGNLSEIPSSFGGWYITLAGLLFRGKPLKEKDESFRLSQTHVKQR